MTNDSNLTPVATGEPIGSEASFAANLSPVAAGGTVSIGEASFHHFCYAISVGVSDVGMIVLSQDFNGVDEPETIIVHPDQVPMLQKWITEALACSKQANLS